MWYSSYTPFSHPWNNQNYGEIQVFCVTTWSPQNLIPTQLWVSQPNSFTTLPSLLKPPWNLVELMTRNKQNPYIISLFPWFPLHLLKVRRGFPAHCSPSHTLQWKPVFSHSLQSPDPEGGATFISPFLLCNSPQLWFSHLHWFAHSTCLLKPSSNPRATHHIPRRFFICIIAIHCNSCWFQCP